MTVLIRPEGQTADDFRFSRRSLGGLTAGAMFTGYAVAALAEEAQPITTDSEGLATGMVSYLSADDFDLPAYVARPDGDGPRGARHVPRPRPRATGADWAAGSRAARRHLPWVAARTARNTPQTAPPCRRHRRRRA